MTKKYLDELSALEKDINDPDYNSWNHFRNLGSWAIEDGKLFAPKKDGKE